jgi:cardiolipin synthase
MEETGRTRAAVRRGVEHGRSAASRLGRWARTLGGRVVIAAAALLALVIFLFALVGLPHVFREPTVHAVSVELEPGPAGLAAAALAATGVALLPGTAAEVSANGDELFPGLWDDLRSAQRSISIVQYYWGAGAVLDSGTQILAGRARAGVAVRVVYDAFGAGDLPAAYFDSLRAAGVRLAEFRPLRWYSLDRATHRSHVRAVIVDGRVGYTGGYGLDDKWLGDGVSAGEWRETSVRLTGPAVQQLEGAFIAHWAEATGELLAGAGPPGAPEAAAGRAEPPAAHRASDTSGTAALAAVVYSPAGIGSSPAERLLALSVAVATRRLWITNAYFVPDDDFVGLLTAAAARGVDVRVLTNGAESDVRTTWFAGRHRYESLLRGGVRIWEYEPTVMHAKTLVADERWVEIGTINFDNRSLAYNEEVAFLAIDAELAARMDSLFRADTGRAREVTLAEFRQRPVLQRLREWASSLVGSIL